MTHGVQHFNSGSGGVGACHLRFVGDMWLDAEEDPTADTQSNSSASDTIAPIPDMNPGVSDSQIDS